MIVYVNIRVYSRISIVSFIFCIMASNCEQFHGHWQVHKETGSFIQKMSSVVQENRLSHGINLGASWKQNAEWEKPGIRELGLSHSTKLVCDDKNHSGRCERQGIGCKRGEMFSKVVQMFYMWIVSGSLIHLLYLSNWILKEICILLHINYIPVENKQHKR